MSILRFSKSIFFVAFIVLCACGEQKKTEGDGDEGDGGASGIGNVNVALTSKAFRLSNNPSMALLEEGCGCSEPGTSMGGSICGSRPDGACFSPTAVRGFFNALQISGTSGGANARLLGGGEKYHGLESVFRTGYFDFSETVFLDGDDNIQDNGGTFDTVGMSVQSIEYQFQAAGGVFNVRIPMVSLPVTADPKFVGCIDEGGLGDSAKYVKLFSAPTSVTAGDILVCVKDNLTDVCTDDEYQWADAEGTLSRTRPTSPLAITGSLAFDKSQCVAGSEHPDVTWGSMYLTAQLKTNFTVTAEIIGGVKQYTSGAKTGNTLDTTVDFDMSNQLYVPDDLLDAFNSTDFEANGATILGGLDRLTLRHIYAVNTRSEETMDSDNMLQAAISVAISEKTEEEDGDVEDLSQTIPDSE